MHIQWQKPGKIRLFSVFILVMMAGSALLATSLFHLHFAQAAGTINAVQYVNPFTGTSGQGTTFPGADVPFGMVQWSPDTTSIAAPGGSYDYSSTTMHGFSLTHFSGAGCSIYRDIPFMPYVGTVNTSPATSTAYDASFSHSSEVAQPGYYSVVLSKSNIKTELTVTPRTGFGQFTYPSSTSATMLMSTTSATGNSAASVNIVSSSNTVTGSATSGNFCSTNGPYTIYFAAQFSQPFSSYGTWKGSTVNHGSTTSSGGKSGAFVTFNTTANPVVLVKVGVSYVSAANALANIQSENSGWDFTGTRGAASSSWNNALNKIQVSGSGTDMSTFYTALYHTMLFPSLFSDANGQYRGFDRNVYTLPAGHAQYANYSGWDIYHGEVALLAMLFPAQMNDMIGSMLNDYSQSGCLPKWSVANYHTDTEDGDSADPIIAEAYAFGATGFNTSLALQAMIKGATTGCTSGSYIERQGLSQYLKYGYIPYGTAGLNGTASATLEYTNDDFAISQFAKALGDSTDATTFANRAENWKKLFNPATGFIEPRDSTGKFVSNSSGRTGFHGGTDAQYTWMIPYNVSGVISTMGGSAKAVSKLNTFFTQLNAGKSSRYAYMGNEPSSASPWTYDFAGQPWQTQSVTRRIETQLYSSSASGIPGNDDLGQISAWYVWAAIGFFPEYPGAGNVVLNSPLFSQITIMMGSGHQTVINASGAADNAPYIQSLSVNGVSSTSTWQMVRCSSMRLELQQIHHGATLPFHHLTSTCHFIYSGPMMDCALRYIVCWSAPISSHSLLLVSRIVR